MHYTTFHYIIQRLLKKQKTKTKQKQKQITRKAHGIAILNQSVNRVYFQFGQYMLLN